MLQKHILSWYNSKIITDMKPTVLASFFFFFFFYQYFLSRTFTIHRTAWDGGGYLFKCSLLYPPASQTLRHMFGDYCRELTSTHSWEPDSNRELLVSECKSLTTQLRALFWDILLTDYLTYIHAFKWAWKLVSGCL